MKKAEGGEFLKEVDSTALQNSVLKIDVAYKNFFRRVKLGEKAKSKLAKKHLKLKNRRNDFLHKLTNNLMIKNMSKKAKGSIANPNMRSSAKSGLNRSILQQSWGKFFELLEYKFKRNGGELIKVEPKFTSQKCSCCGYISKENRESQSKFICKQCGYSINADYNASLNILYTAGSVAKAS